MEPHAFNPAVAATELKNWLDGAANYTKGVDLYLKYGGDKGLVARTLRPKGACPANKRLLKSKINRMIEEFEKLAPAPVAETETTETTTETGDNPPRVELPQVGLRKLYPNIKLEEAPDEIKLMFAEAIGAYNTMVKAHDKDLSDDMTEEQKLEKLNELYQANESNKAAHAELKHFNDTGKLLGKHPKLEMAAYKEQMTDMFAENPVKVQKERDKCYNNYARHKKQLDEGDFKDKAEKESYVKKWKEQLDICDNLLKTE